MIKIFMYSKSEDVSFPRMLMLVPIGRQSEVEVGNFFTCSARSELKLKWASVHCSRGN